MNGRLRRASGPRATTAVAALAALLTVSLAPNPPAHAGGTVAIDIGDDLLTITATDASDVITMGWATDPVTSDPDTTTVRIDVGDATPALSGSSAESCTVAGSVVDCPTRPSVEIGLGGGDDVLRLTSRPVDPTLSSFLAVEGGTGADDISARNGAESDADIGGGPGDDRISGGYQRDDLHGDDGDDYVEGGRGSDVVDGDGGRDFVFGGLGDDTVNGGCGRDWISGGHGNDRMIADGDCPDAADRSTADYIDAYDDAPDVLVRCQKEGDRFGDFANVDTRDTGAWSAHGPGACGTVQVWGLDGVFVTTVPRVVHVSPRGVVRIDALNGRDRVVAAVLSARTAKRWLAADETRLRGNSDGILGLDLDRRDVRYLERHPQVRGSIKVTFRSGTQGIVRERVRFVVD